MKHIYCISGFGADERVFNNLDFGNHYVHHIAWKIPERNETLNAYSQRMAAEIKHANPVIIGLSFGGMLSIEIAKLIPVEKLILISSIKTFHEKPLYLRIAAKSYLNKILPLKSFSFLEPIQNYNLGIEQEEEKQLAREYRKKVNPLYVHWAINEIINWKNDWIPENVIHIHGNNDHIFPSKNVKPDYVIDGGGHLMLMNKAGKINEILKTEI